MNRKLKRQLNKANIAYDSESIFDEKMESAVEYDPNQGERIIGKYITEELAKKFFAMFWGRNDRICPKQLTSKYLITVNISVYGFFVFSQEGVGIMGFSVNYGNYL